MKHKLLRIFLICLVSFEMYNASGSDPVTPNASPEARALLNYIYTSHLYNHNKDELKRIYNHDLVITRDELPNIMDYLNVKGETKTTYLFQNPDMPLEERVSNIVSLMTLKGENKTP